VTEDERRQICEEAKATLDRLKRTQFGLHDPPSDLIEQRRRSNMEEPKRRERGLDVDCDARIAAAVAAEHEFMIELIGAALAEALADQRRLFELEVKQRMIDIKTDLVEKMERNLARLIHALDDDKGKTLDLPDWPTTRREVN
jgi:hypothetical protein